MSFSAESSYSKNKTKIELDLCNYASKSEVKKQQLLIHYIMNFILIYMMN